MAVPGAANAGKPMRRFRAHALLAGTIFIAFASAGRAADPDQPVGPVVHYRDGRVTVQASGAARAEVIAALSRAAGFSVQGDVQDSRPVHKHFANVRLRDALGRLLGNQNFVLVYDDAGRPARVSLLGMPEPPAAPPARAVRVPVPPRRPIRPPAPPPTRLGSPRVTFVGVRRAAR